MNEEVSTSKSTHKTPTHVVALGASGGGLEALESFFNAVDDNLSCAYVVIQRLSPDFKSMMAANEELQSTNEELQSVNEELYTVNSEYQQKIIELTDTNNDLENLLNATDLAVLFLDGDLNIRRYTRPIRKFINIMDFDLERPFQDLSLKIRMDNVHEIVRDVNAEGKSHSSVIEFENNKSIEVSISPYSIGSDNQGVVISMREK
ncbi:MAG: PAS domain-containing protein [Glaciecola sp.]